MRGRLIALLAAALLVVGLLAVPGLATFTDTDTDSASSEAEISVVDCVVESTKDISYVAFLDSGEELDRFDINAPTYDLTGYGDIDSVDSVRVKSGETVESFVVDCGESAGTDEEPTEDPTEDSTEDPTEEPTDKPTEDDDEDEGTVESHNDKAGANSKAVITVSGCTVNSSKDISYIAFLNDGDQVDKIEGVDSQSYDLAGYPGIDDVDAIRVKAGTTVASFSVNCGTADTDGDAVNDDTKDEDAKDEEHDSKDEDATPDEHDEDAKEEDSTEDVADDDSEEDSDDDDAETDEEWDARHDGRHDHMDHQEVEHEDS